MEELAQFLAETVERSRHCAHCIHKYTFGCFFAYECIKNEYSMYKEDEDEGDV